MASEKLPKESIPQEIGQHALKCYEAHTPLGWRCKDLSGDDDVGLDQQVQIVSDKLYTGFFHTQIKGSRQRDANGKCSDLSAAGDFYSVSLDVSTINYYSKLACQVMLVFADLTQDSNPRRCKVYYAWIKDEIAQLLMDGLLDTDLETKTFRVPTANVLNDDTDVLPFLLVHQSKSKDFHSIDNAVNLYAASVDAPVSKIAKRLNSGPTATLSLLNDTDRPWIDPPPDSIAAKLLYIAQDIEHGIIDSSESKLEAIEDNVRSNGTDHEVSELDYLQAQLNLQRGNTDNALQFLESAVGRSPKNDTYRLAFIEQQILVASTDKSVLTDLATQLECNDKSGNFTLLFKIRLLLGDFEEAREFIDLYEIDDHGLHTAILFYHEGDFAQCEALCVERIDDKSLSDRYRLSFGILYTRAIFVAKIEPSIVNSGQEKTPYAGLPEMDTKSLELCWSALKRVWELANKLNYPTDIELVIDISEYTSRYFGQANWLWFYMEKLSCLRTESSTIQQSALELAFTVGDYKFLTNKLDSFSLDAKGLVFKAKVLNEINDLKSAVSLVDEYLDVLMDGEPDDLDFTLLFAARSAGKLVLSEKLAVFRAKLQSLPNAEAMLCILDFYLSVDENPLHEAVAHEKLWKLVESGNNDDHLAGFVLFQMSSDVPKYAAKIIKISGQIQEKRKLSEQEAFVLCQSLCDQQLSAESLVVSIEALQRYEHSRCLRVIHALALNMEGNIPESIAILEPLVFAADFEQQVFELYAHIASNCGLLANAMDTYEALLLRTEDRKHKCRLLHVLFLLENALRDTGKRLYDLCNRYGAVCDQKNEVEESVYLHHFIASSGYEDANVEEPQVDEYRRRLKAFEERFPNSSLMRSTRIDMNAAPEKMFSELFKFADVTDAHLKAQKKIDTQIEKGSLRVPFAIRAEFLSSIPDMIWLWEISKASDGNKDYLSLQMDGSSSTSNTETALLRDTPVLIDGISMLVLFDLELLDDVFQYLNNIVICRSTVDYFNTLSLGVFRTFSNDKSKKVLESISKFATKIQLPSGGVDTQDSGGIKIIQHQIELLRKKNLLFYSDDALAGSAISEISTAQSRCTSGDLILEMYDAGIISLSTSTEKLSLLCKWNVKGVPIRTIHILDSLQHDLKPDLNIQSVLTVLDGNQVFSDITKTQWGNDEGFESVRTHISHFVSQTLLPVNKYQVDDSIIEGIWISWYRKCQFRQDCPFLKADLVSRVFVDIAIIFLSEDIQSPAQISLSQRLWGIYSSTIQYLFRDEKDQYIENALSFDVVKHVKTIDRFERHDVYDFLRKGLTDGTSEYETFVKQFEK